MHLFFKIAGFSIYLLMPEKLLSLQSKCHPGELWCGLRVEKA